MNTPRRSPIDARRQGYELVAAAIHLLLQPEPPALDELARRLQVPPLRLQRTFGAFAGVSPKRFLQFLTKEHALALLRRQESSVMDCALDSGLSGPARLHDLLVHCEALTPGEARRLGEGVELGTAVVDSPFGRAFAAASPRGLSWLSFLEGGGREEARARLLERWPRATLREDRSLAGRLEPRLAGLQASEPLHLALRGTNFQIRVWEALLRVPAGRLTSYSALARSVGRPDATRAVAGAVASNPVALLIPCHRVIRESGALGGYRWGLERKAALIAAESGRPSVRQPGRLQEAA